jgi:hypothetical protein
MRRLWIAALCLSAAEAAAQTPKLTDSRDGEAGASALNEKPKEDAIATSEEALASSGEPLPFIQHVPLHHVELGPLELLFQIRDPDRAGTVVLFLVHEGQTKKSEQPAPVSFEAHRTERGYEVAIPATSLREPGFAYWVLERRADGSERALFASKEEPQPVRVTLAPADEAERGRLRERDGRRSTIVGSAEWVDFGNRRLLAGDVLRPDRYYRLETGYAYSFLRTIEDVQLTVVRVRGEAGVLPEQAFAPMAVSLYAEPGIDYGRARITLLAAEGVRLRGSSLLGASQRGFEYGGGGEVVLGDPEGASFSLGVERITTLGATGHMRLGFALTERLPMGAALELTTFPLGQDAGVRLLYDVAYVYAPGSSVALRAGFQGRTSVTGGPSAGLMVRHAF